MRQFLITHTYNGVKYYLTKWKGLKMSMWLSGKNILTSLFRTIIKQGKKDLLDNRQSIKHTFLQWGDWRRSLRGATTRIQSSRIRRQSISLEKGALWSQTSSLSMEQQNKQIPRRA